MASIFQTFLDRAPKDSRLSFVVPEDPRLSFGVIPYTQIVIPLPTKSSFGGEFWTT